MPSLHCLLITTHLFPSLNLMRFSVRDISGRVLIHF
uniref:Uncharacterized protein n=1 Tax=Podoviridae sp. cttxo15 TaxID=2826584 RepID=A0A8S5N2I2_9CAUD|nr:MAG TPA: hypothetical protein [Podoviridae sp. cttxo15]